MKAFSLVIVCLSLIISNTEAKGIRIGGGGMKYPKAKSNPYGGGGFKAPEPRGNQYGGGGFKFPESKGYQYGGGGLMYSHKRKMGFGRMPLFIPVVIPMGGIGRHRNSYRYDGLQCFACEGTDKDMCVINPISVSKRITCPYNQYCSVLRREFLFETVVPVYSQSTNHSTSMTATTVDPHEDQVNGTNNSNSSKVIAYETKNITKVLISRGCKSPELLQNHIMESGNEGINGSGVGVSTATYSQFCLTDFCNFGDGRLKCYDCDGIGTNHSCMVRPADVATIVTCDPNEYCNIMRATTLNVTDNSTVLTVSISRGCKLIGSDDDFDTSDGTSILSLSCSSDLCNFVDATYLAPINSATISSFERYQIFFMILIHYVSLTILRFN